MKNYSRKREAIIKVLQNSKSHPTAKEVYEEVRKEIPNISLGTVYRNLSELSYSGDISTVSVGGSCEHYDGDTSPHIHLRCTECGSITDVFVSQNPLPSIIENYGFTAKGALCVVYGICKNCSDNLNL